MEYSTNVRLIISLIRSLGITEEIKAILNKA